MATKQIAGITVPDTPLIEASTDLARKHLDDWAYNHVMRSWLFGCAIADKVILENSRCCDDPLHHKLT